MKDLIIIGAGGLGREALRLALEIQDNTKDAPWRVKGFITDIPGDFYEKDTGGYKIIGTIKDHVIEDNNVYVFAIADIPFKKKTTADFLSRGAEFINLIAPDVRTHHSLKIGIGNIIQHGVILSTDIEIGNFNMINAYTTIGHDARIKDCTTISPNCAIAGYCEVEDEAFLGAHVVLYPHACVGTGASVCAGSVVPKRVKPQTMVIGNPAVKI